MVQTEVNRLSLKGLLNFADQGINVEKNIAEVAKRLQSNEYTLELILEIIKKDISNKVNILNMIASKCCEKSLSEAALPIFKAALQYDLSSEVTITNITLFLKATGRGSLIKQYLRYT